MDLELRTITEEEHPTWSRQIARAFGNDLDDEEVAAWRQVTELDRTIAALEENEIVGTAGAFTFQMALPGGATLPVAGVTAVSVQPTHRRRGVLRRMMAHQLDDVARRAESVAVLTASETSIYGRFGYGLGSQFSGWVIEKPVELQQAARAPGRIRLIEKAEAARVLPALREAVWRRYPGELSWSETWWDEWFRDPPKDRDGASERRYSVHESRAGQPDGYVAWRVRPKWEAGLAVGDLRVAELYGLDDEVEAALWEFLCSIDLIKTISTWSRPVEEPLRWRLVDFRRMKVTGVGDHLWIRLVDIPRALSARQLGADARLTVRVEDEFRPETAGTYVIEPGRCRRDDNALAEVSMHVRDLGALYLGAVSATTLARAGRVHGTPADLAKADSLLASATTPWCSTHF